MRALKGTKMSKEHPYLIPEYDGNPFIARLPPIKSRKEIFKSLQFKPDYSEEECGYPAHYRKHFVLRLGRFFEPVSRHVELAERLDYILRQGYVGRNPMTHDYIRHLQNDFHRTRQKDIFAENLLPVENTATSFSVIGCSGVGKSKAIEKILHQYPSRISHTEPFSLVQLPWLKLDCPHQGSPRQLCKNFFASLDRLLGTEYEKLYGNVKAGLDEMLVHMAQVANLHALGLLVIDEIQHLRKSKSSQNLAGSDQLLNFLVTLVNTIGVPVVLIGTLSAKAILQKDFRQARRGAGFGAAQWDRYPYDVEWKHIVERIWKYQWTRTYTPLSTEILDVLYDESQGILDVLVKLIMLTQLKIISINEVRAQGEHITPDLIKMVAAEDFKLIHPMINALRNNDYEAIFQYDDLYDFTEHIANRVSKVSGVLSQSSIDLTTSKPEIDKVAVLMRMGISEEQARQIAGSVDGSTSTKPKVLSHAEEKRNTSNTHVEGDLREALATRDVSSPTVYEVLKHQGIISCPLEDFEVGT